MVDKRDYLRIFTKSKHYREVFNKDSGAAKAVLADLSKECMALSSTMASTPYDTAFNEGKRCAFLYILRNINIDLSSLQEALKEGQSE